MFVCMYVRNYNFFLQEYVLCMYAYLFEQVCKCIFMHVCKYFYIFTCVCMYVCMYVCTVSIFIFVHVSICMFVCTGVYKCTCISIIQSNLPAL